MSKTIININDKEYKLKKCPFCGSNKVELYFESDTWGMNSFATAYVFCNECKSRGPRIEANVLSDDMKEKVICSWNNR